MDSICPIPSAPGTRAIITGLLSGNARQQQLGQALCAIFTDPPPADNNLTVNLAVGALTGPTNGAAIGSGSAVLGWAPVWGASVYHVTVYSAGGSMLTPPPHIPACPEARAQVPVPGFSSRCRNCRTSRMSSHFFVSVWAI